VCTFVSMYCVLIVITCSVIFILQVETEEEAHRANDAGRRHQVMVPERDVTGSRPKRPVLATDVKLQGPRPSPAGYRCDVDVMSTHSCQCNKENMSRPVKFKVRGCPWC